MPESWVTSVTDFGADAVTVSLIVALFGYFFVTHQKYPALTVLAAFGLTGVILSILKFALYSRCDATVFAFDLRSPSGHSGLSLAAYFLLAGFISTALTGWRRYIPFIIALPLVGTIAFSRLVLNIHTKADVVIGLAVGAASSLLAWRLLMHGRAVRGRWGVFVVLFLATLALAYGSHFSGDIFISFLSHYFRSHVQPC